MPSVSSSGTRSRKLIQSEAAAVLDLTQTVIQFFDKQALAYSRGTTSFLVASFAGASFVLLALAICLSLGVAGWNVLAICALVAIVGFSGSLLVYRLVTRAVIAEKTHEDMLRMLDQIAAARASGASKKVLDQLWANYLSLAALSTPVSQERKVVADTGSREAGKLILAPSKSELESNMSPEKTGRYPVAKLREAPQPSSVPQSDPKKRGVQPKEPKAKAKGGRGRRRG